MNKNLASNVIRFEVPSCSNRERIILGLADSGYNVWIEEKKVENTDYKYSYFVCVKISKPKAEDDELECKLCGRRKCKNKDMCQPEA